jgi:hypothetical protein
VGAVPVAVLRLGVAVDEVPAGEDVGSEVGVRRVDARVDHGHRHLLRAGGEVPGDGRFDVAQAPFAVVERVVRRRVQRARVVGLGVEHALALLEIADGVAHGHARLGIIDLEPLNRERPVALDARVAADVRALRLRSVGREAHEDAGDRLRARCRRHEEEHRTRHDQQAAHDRSPGRVPAYRWVGYAGKD